ncbi:MAG: hypothetical protein KatS3mg006_2276 [Pyrinomonadaceae bacterium]|jgi:hypothetical protein|nr:MAG: hypothetical protein KatS3mg006_2276 [Pyrinomonadaceae bacterium]
MRIFQNGLADLAHFSCLAVDRHSPAYDHRRFSEDFHAYNRFTAMALKAGISWHLRSLDELTIHFISDAKDRKSKSNKGFSDNFDKYLAQRIELDAFLKRDAGEQYPYVRLETKLCDSNEEDLLQLCDVLLGATQCALLASSEQPAKRALGQMIVRWHQDLRLPPQKQEYKLQRKFNLWGFPDHEGRPYNNVTLALPVDDRQESLF